MNVPGAPEWVGTDPTYGDYCRHCGAGVGDPAAAVHEAGCPVAPTR